MLWVQVLLLVLYAPIGLGQSIDGIYDLVRRRIPRHADSFRFSLVDFNSTGNDQFVVSSTDNDTILVEGSTLSALSYGLHRYLADIAHVDIYWYIGSQLHLAPTPLPHLSQPLTGSSTVEKRYHFNTVTFSYTTAFWSWEDWELQLDWMALRGINLPLAWVGQEKILVEVFRETGMTDAEISSFLSGPAFQAWNRFGNIQGSWHGELPYSWIDAQFELQKKIVRRMVELGMTPVLPAFTGFVPRAITRVLPDATVVNGSRWSGFDEKYTNDTFLEPFDPNFARLQRSFIHKQQQAYGNITHIYTLDQYNENDPYSGDPEYLRNVTHNTWQSLKSADPDAIWMMQGWLFYSNSDFWTDERVHAYLSGVETDEDMLVLDLFSESQPQWQRTQSYYGKPWIWCQLHDYGGNMGLYGQVMNITVNATDALAVSDSLVGYGLTMEGQEGNEIVYDLLLDQAWSSRPIDTDSYFHDWVKARYSTARRHNVPHELYQAWDILRTTAYNNTNLATATAVSKSIFELQPKLTGLVNQTGHHPTVVNYEASSLVRSWKLMVSAASESTALWSHPAFRYDMVDVTRQVMANAFIPMYLNVTSTYQKGGPISQQGDSLIRLLRDLDAVLSTNDNFRLATWIESARTWARNDTEADFYEYNARNQITLWGPKGRSTATPPSSGVA
ncbi:alpha-N-acetylglucosaminidase [Aspergillus clavatus NRRL 1]|uniref:Alpha-N-acetylglucosaminidase, putative n=1 Tax=Aspergillus clavatus (strain ATCC 1007 / CBS 513.65 / DSM 816 / NCTC 3887 / NRRL 1 / QM 1276 / 107) TaxID=344612 RepID=A1CSZ6_ASPCL|nr:alpha-N-acetylglucosaminidase, putative [Aspergillus clavatus NRRL 1]EAW06433.1 alpha-N-acetylglucosaminidase, putative [Aspergillus clavatus NRRL 1]